MKLSADAKLGILTVICMFVNAVAFKNILHVQPDFLTSYGPFWVLLIYVISKDYMKDSDRNPLYWGMAIIFVTIATIILYAFF